MRVQTTRFLNGIDLEKKSKKLAELFDRIQRLPDNWIGDSSRSKRPLAGALHHQIGGTRESKRRCADRYL
ncbi:hypothetical protein ACVWZ3_000497 [Bradyrhizobium sp. i1.3.6]